MTTQNGTEPMNDSWEELFDDFHLDGIDAFTKRLIEETEERLCQVPVPEPEECPNLLTITADCPELTLKIEHAPLRSAWVSPFDDDLPSFGESEYALYEGPAVSTVCPLRGSSSELSPKLFLRMEGEFARCIFCGEAFSMAIGESFAYHEPICDAMEAFTFTLTRERT